MPKRRSLWSLVAKKADLMRWARENHLSSSGRVKELKGRIQDSFAYKERLSVAQQLFSSKGHQLVYLPACHPEYNLMELIWAKVKRHCTEHCDYTKAGTWRSIQEGMRKISSEDCERMARHCHDKMVSHWTLFGRRKWGSRINKRQKVKKGEEK